MDPSASELLLVLPLGTALTLGARLVLGVRTIGTFIPALLALNVYHLGGRTVAITLAIAAMGVVAVLPVVDRLALPKATRLAIVAVVIMGALEASGVLADGTGTMPIVVMAIMVERIWDCLHVDGAATAVRLGTTTVGLGYGIGGLVGAWAALAGDAPWPVLAAAGIAMNVAVGSYRGLRVTELRRFRTVRAVEVLGPQRSQVAA